MLLQCVNSEISLCPILINSYLANSYRMSFQSRSTVVIFDLRQNDSVWYRFDQFGCSGCVEEAKHLKHLLIFRLYMKLQASGWPLILLSRKSWRQQNATVGHLISAGYSGWTSLIMRYCYYVPFF